MSIAYDILPYIAAAACGSHHSLKVWLALQQAPAPDTITSTKHSTLGVLAVLFSVVGVEAGIVFGLQLLDQTAVDYIWVACTYVLCVLILIGAAAALIPTDYAVFRQTDGTFRYRFCGSRAKRLVLVGLASVLPVVGLRSAWLGNHIPGVVFATTYALFISSRSLYVRKTSVRFLMLLLLGYEVVLLLFCGFLALYQHYIRSNPESADSTDSEDDSEPFVRMPNKEIVAFLMNTFVYTMKALYLCMPGLMASVALRFDYHIHSLSNFAPIDVAFKCRDIPSSEKPTGLSLPDGVVIPSTLPSFSKPTFRAAMLAIFISFVGADGVLRAVGWDEPLGSAVAGMLIAIPLASLAMVCTAYKAGNMKAMWTYTEIWALPPTPEPTAEVKEETPLLIDVV